MKSSLLLLLLYLCLTATDLPLNKTKVQMNWKEFQELSTQRVDTVIITPKSKPPVSMVWENCDISISLADSSAEGTLVLSYVVLSESDWVKKVIFPTTDMRFHEIVTEKGDVVVPTDSGYILIAHGRSSGESRSLTLRWNGTSLFDAGTRNFLFEIPTVSTGSLTFTTPSNFTNVEFDDATLISKDKGKNQNKYHYSYPRTPKSRVTYAPPIQTTEENDITVDTTPVIRETQITTSQEVIHFLSEERTLAISDLELTVNHSPITKFTVEIPKGTEILTVEGNGINRWGLRDSSTLDVELTFELSGAYHLYITGEVKKDSLCVIKPFSVVGSEREKGKIAIALEGAGEAHFTSMENGTPLPRNLFLSSMSGKLRASCAYNKLSVDDIILSAEFNSANFISTIETRHHKPAKVTNAVVDSAEIFTALTKEYKTITTARFYVRQRNRQFIELSLPSQCELWGVQINETEVTPYMDKEGSVKIPLQRFGFADSYKVPLVLSFTYYEKLPQDDMQISLRTPLPDIAVNRLNWSLFYPEEWKVKKSAGDFSTHQQLGIRKIRHSLTEEQQLSQYNLLQKEIRNQKMIVSQELPLIGLSPNYLVGKRILIVGEKPLLTINFIEAKTVAIKRALIALFTVLVLIVLTIRAVLKRK